ncbi:P-TEFb-associated cyclin-dependent protein kinase Cdk9 [Schizosaccharomyces pombe]|uniref:Probable cyclin-dependent kinase 9 n=1 Tax=Schizosaccharomyces pombe (strain 972 / ATCC 24843) TaxID=284812 RepID=CDK9_SCHPO|nr:P-TEFb-associated cyclin-dependent protein kinase Cdk9 [Schizosaccharomyces pombe]Q96WV9.1 RecName: Full=Probable cyclin-dependent kinase 9; AltName: Full=Cell division protein kinase 9 [Schizosaccharomyces pombe 972h-]CAC37500.1 P-TEFb-associated cyclin-dependent protein kinase Cdk9 [Schizosaccharomyces pombe]|eukprot:NP_595616.1 P-TEFb-associated cyclin-dependent protein kinase Cdk9 [Schizosaccharomyces pombe]
MKRSSSVSVEDEKSARRKLDVVPKLHFVGCSHLTDYHLMEKLGEGTFGEVYKSQRRKDGKVYALKRILMHTEKEGFPITAIREIKILKSIKHENIIPLSDMTVVRADKKHRRRGSIYMVTPYMDHDLSGLLENPSVKFTEPQIKCYMKQLFAGTKYLHDQLILHRDLKAANLLIDNHGILKIADFGLARVITEESYANKNPGLPPPNRREYTGCVVTRWYRSPELLLGERRYTTAIDMWSVGCIMAEMYKGRPILQGSSDLDQLDKIFRLCGSPTQATMPNWEKLPGCEGVRSFPSHPRTLETAFFTFGKEMTSLCGAILTLNPDERLSASMALEHEYFTTPPYPANPSELQSYSASHEYDKRRKREQRDANSHAFEQTANGKRQFRFMTRGPSDPWYGIRRPNYNSQPQYQRGSYNREGGNMDRSRNVNYQPKRQQNFKPLTSDLPQKNSEFSETNAMNQTSNHSHADGQRYYRPEQDRSQRLRNPSDYGRQGRQSSQSQQPAWNVSSRYQNNSKVQTTSRASENADTNKTQHNIKYIDSYVPEYSIARQSANQKTNEQHPSSTSLHQQSTSDLKSPSFHENSNVDDTPK